MSGKLVLYYLTASMPSRSCYLLAKLLNVDVKIKEVMIPKGDQFTDEFVKINPLKKIPVLVDNDFVVSDSHAILSYLINSKAPGNALYPNDPRKRAIIDQRLFFDATVLFASLIAVIRPVVVERKKTIAQDLKGPIESALAMMELYLKDDEYIAGNNLTIADISTLPNITTAKEFGFDLTKYPQLNEWHKRMEKLPGFDENLLGAKQNAEYLRKVTGGPIFQF